ncbi:MAG: glutamate--cysteine ligase [Alphaproteobacteria bacterium]|nr:glutamate--cysteine ligase [Alphaproteobacteria bacterium]MBT4964647.1 glutamate--cysteine ligase [Alphaproteobacteria bacterium]MBT5161687.1 glutamate--cysteine ligase [Alphaproteobacteria bacterium]MBT5917499.1 glutamate--cysteine ligase [Alphaproteobacteria bacterium]MBT6384253.1 glutamate--cysteine ligase [Alphaproteobacteria bacterium]
MVEYLEKGNKPAADWRIGTEHEKFGFRLDDLRPLEYDGPQGIAKMFEGMERFGWQPILEDGKAIAMAMDGQSITLEPGGQFELSGAPLENLNKTCDEVNTHLRQIKEVAGEMGVGFLGLGFQPKWGIDDIPIMPKGRYKLMRDYMPTRGKLGRDMMFRTSTVQVNLDFASEADMVQKYRVALALQPVGTALFANSPFTEGKPNGYLSYRSHIWTDVDPDRTGQVPFVFEDGFGFERYVDYALDVPMYFVYRDGNYINALGQSFRDFLKGELPALPGEKPTMLDWENHLTTLFPEVRLKQFIELRGADGGQWRRLCAMPALWTGVLYDDAACAAAWELCKDWTTQDRADLMTGVAREGIQFDFKGRKVKDLAADVIEIANDGLKARNRTDSFGDDERHFLSAVKLVIEDGRTPAEELLEAYHGRWNGSVDPVFEEYAY